jgi:hypothetical protein
MRCAPPRRFASTALTLAVLAGGAPVPLHSQESRQIDVLAPHLQSRTPAPGDELERAEDTRRELRRVLDSYSPALGRILKLDPTLMTNAGYLAPYPALAGFLQAHPEVARDPAYFLEFIDSTVEAPVSAEVQARRDAIWLWRDFFTAGMVFSGFLAAALSLGWLIRYVVGHRRWLRTVKLQSDVHGRLMERFTSNEELMTYIQSPAGRQFLQGLPAAPEVASAPAVAAPINRILWSVQAGLVLGCAGVGLLVIRHYLIEEIAEVLLVFGVLGVSVGIGFALAAAASYMLSHRLGLFDPAGLDGSKRA